MEDLKKQVEVLMDNSQYNDAVNLVMKEIGFSIDKSYFGYGFHFEEDKEKNIKRHIWEITIRKGSQSYTFNFGNALVYDKNKKPSDYGIISCIVKQSPGTFTDFCRDYGYDTDNKTAERIYHKVVNEYDNLVRVLGYKNLEVLEYIH